MPSLGFSVDHKAPAARRRTPADIRRAAEQRGDGPFVVGMVSLGLFIVAAAAWHDQARLLLRLIGF
jgi:hypothetical protein